MQPAIPSYFPREQDVQESNRRVSAAGLSEAAPAPRAPPPGNQALPPQNFPAPGIAPKSAQSQPWGKREQEGESKYGEGNLVPYCPSMCWVSGMNPGLCLHSTMMFFFCLFTFCALCVNELSYGEAFGVEYYCTWRKNCIEDFCRFHEEAFEIENIQEDTTTNAGKMFCAFGVLSFFLEMFLFAQLMDMHHDFLKEYTNIHEMCGSKMRFQFVCSCILWIMITLAWGDWANNNQCNAEGLEEGDVTDGDSINLLIAVWVFLVPHALGCYPPLFKICWGNPEPSTNLVYE